MSGLKDEASVVWTGLPGGSGVGGCRQRQARRAVVEGSRDPVPRDRSRVNPVLVVTHQQ